jgi:hypothetical protein
MDFVQKSRGCVGFMGDDDASPIVEAKAFRRVAGNHI